MQLILLRHGIAEELVHLLISGQGRTDADRQLTPEGQVHMQKIAKEMQGFVSSLDLIVSSPYLRAKQTAQIVADHYPKVPLLETESLTPDYDGQEFMAWMKEHARGLDCVLAVGHEPNLCQLGSWLMGSDRSDALQFDRGGMACLQFESQRLEERHAELKWLVQPKNLF